MDDFNLSFNHFWSFKKFLNRESIGIYLSCQTKDITIYKDLSEYRKLKMFEDIFKKLLNYSFVVSQTDEKLEAEVVKRKITLIEKVSFLYDDLKINR